MRRRVKEWLLVYRSAPLDQGFVAELWSVPPTGLGIKSTHQLQVGEDRLPLEYLAEIYSPPGKLLSGLERYGWPWVERRKAS